MTLSGKLSNIVACLGVVAIYDCLHYIGIRRSM